MRTDIHKPSVINPDDYQYVCSMTRPVEIGDAIYLEQERRYLELHMGRTGGSWSNHEHGGNCHVCGAHFVDYAVFWHQPTNVYIKTGLECADKLGGGNREAFQKVKTERQAMERAKMGKLKAAAILKERGIFDQISKWSAAPGEIGGAFDPHSAHFDGLDDRLALKLVGWLESMHSLVVNLIRSGELSESQWDYLDRLVALAENVRKLQAKIDEERKSAPPVPEGRQEVTGIILGLKWEEGRFQNTLKMLLQDDRGFKVWTTVPKVIMDKAEKGTRLSFEVTLSRSETDPVFGIGKRPTKAKILV